jgi:ligand-binding sensor domain-containing protein
LLSERKKRNIDTHHFYIRNRDSTTSKIHQCLWEAFSSLKKRNSVLVLGTTIIPRMFISFVLKPVRFVNLMVLLTLLAFHGLEAQESSLSGLPFIRTFPTIEYQAGIQNWVLTEDRRGLLYVANNFGLLEFDGVKWQIHGVKNGTKVRSVAVSNKGRIYVGSQGDFGYFKPQENGQLFYVSLADSLEARYRNFDEAWSIYIDEETVYFCTFSRIYIYNGATFTVVEGSGNLDLSFLVNQRLIVQTTDNGLSALRGKILEPMKGGDFFKGISVSSILPLNAEEFLVSTFEHGIFTMSANGNVSPWNDKFQPFFRAAQVNCFVRLKNGNYAAGTQNNGLLILNPSGSVLMQLTRGRGLENRTVLGLYEDDRHNLWVGQNNGIAHVELGSPFSFINEQSGLPGTGYSALLDGDDFFLGTNTGLYHQDRREGGDFKLIENSRGQIYHVGKYAGSILAGHHRGTFEINGHAKAISSEPGSWTFLQLKDHPEKLIGGTYYGLQLFEMVNGKWQWKKKLAGFAESARVMAEDVDGNLWVTHGYKGAFKVRLAPSGDSITSVTFYGQDKGFPSHLLVNVFSVRNQLLFTSQRGVFVYDKANDRFIHDTLFTKLFGENVQIWFVQEDAFGNIYFTGEQYMGVLRKNSIGEYALENGSFNKIRKYLNDDLINITILQNNEVLFGAKDGFIHFNPARVTASATNFKTLIRRVTVTSPADSVIFFGNYTLNGELTDRQPIESRPSLPNENNSMHFSFAASAYEGNENRVYQYYLENYEDNWSEWAADTQKEYTNLKEGDYVFHVRARNMNGEISSVASYSFHISPPWYRSVIAYVFYALSFSGLLFVGFNLLDRKYQREQKILEEKQQQELEQKEHEIEKLSIQSQEEITRLQHEKLESDLRHMNNELATATMHLLNKNEFITGIKGHLTHIIKKNGHDETRRELLQITKDIENNISDDSDWEHFQFHFDRVHGDFSTRFKSTFPGLTPQEIKLSAYLRMNLSTKEIAQLLNISVRGVEISRYRLRKKLHLDRNQNLQDFILNF